MTMESIERLAGRLGVPPHRLQPLSPLDAADVERLDAVVADALSTGDRAFESGLAEALRIVPRPLRGAARRLLFPGGGE